MLVVFASHDPRMFHPHTVKQHETAFNILMFIIKMTWCEPNDGKMRWFTLVSSLYCSKVWGLWASWLRYDQLTRWMMSTRRTTVATERRCPRRPNIYEMCCFSMWFRTFSSLFKAVSFENSSWWYQFSLQAPVSTLLMKQTLMCWMCFTFLMDTYIDSVVDCFPLANPWTNPPLNSMWITIACLTQWLQQSLLVKAHVNQGVKLTEFCRLLQSSLHLQRLVGDLASSSN